MQILLADHRLSSGRALSRAMATAGVIVDYAVRGDEAAEMLRCGVYDAVVLASDLPVIRGLQILRQLRSEQSLVPVLILAEDSTTASEIEARQSGADDFMVGPLELEAMVKRLQGLARRSHSAASATLRVDAIEMNLDTRQATFHGTPISLTGKEFALLHLLAMRRGSVLSKDAILTHLYGGIDEPEAKIIDVFICKLRKKLQIFGVKDLIITVWGRGYMLREGRTEQAMTPRTNSPVSAPAWQIA